MLVGLFFDHLRQCGCELQDDYDPYLPIYINPVNQAHCAIELIEAPSYSPIQVAMYCDALKIQRPFGYEHFPSISIFMGLHEQAKMAAFDGENGEPN